jgi:uncharacterized protein
VIRARFISNNSAVCGFEISGHSGYADKGSDIVCASVSSAVQMAANTIIEVIGSGAYVSRKNGEVSLRLLRSEDKAKIAGARNIITGLRLHLFILSMQYQGTIDIEDSEV